MSGMVIRQKYEVENPDGRIFDLRTNLGSRYLLSKNKRGELYFKTDHRYWLQGMGRKENTMKNRNAMTDYRKRKTFFFFLQLQIAGWL